MQYSGNIMDPSTLEMLVLLRFNRDLWSDRNVDTIISRTQSAAPPVIDDLPIPSTSTSTPFLTVACSTPTACYVYQYHQLLLVDS